MARARMACQRQIMHRGKIAEQPFSALHPSKGVPRLQPLPNGEGHRRTPSRDPLERAEGVRGAPFPWSPVVGARWWAPAARRGARSAQNSCGHPANTWANKVRFGAGLFRMRGPPEARPSKNEMMCVVDRPVSYKTPPFAGLACAIRVA